jgi:hypothetical protein
MTIKDVCRVCGGATQLVRCLPPARVMVVVGCDRCKDTMGWDPDAWKREHGDVKPEILVADEEPPF